MSRLTLFTPTYNRAYVLPNLYKCMINQTSKDFVWLIVDDGSTDNTESLVSDWIKEGHIKIEYAKKENGGKNTAMDLANSICTTDYIGIVDSDDLITDDCVEVINQKIAKVDSLDNCGGIVAIIKMINSYKDSEQTFNGVLTKEEIAPFSKLREIFGKIPETFIILKTSIAKSSRFPVIKGEKFITENVYYQPIFRKYDLLFIPEQLYTAQYIADGYSLQGMSLFFKNPKGYLFSLRQNAHYSIIDKKPFKEKLIDVSAYMAWNSVFGNIDNIKDKELNYEIPLFYKLCGSIFKYKFLKNYKKQYKEWKLNNIKK